MNRIAIMKIRRLFISGSVLASLVGLAQAQPPALTHLKNVLLLNKSQGGSNSDSKSRSDFVAVLDSLAADKGFSVAKVNQGDGAATLTEAFSKENLAKTQVVFFLANNGVDKMLDSASKVNLEEYVKAGGGFIGLIESDYFVSNWSWYSSAMVQSYTGHHTANQPQADLHHDAEGMTEGSEAAGIFRNLTPPKQFTDKFISFDQSPRGANGVTVLVTMDEGSSTQPISAPMGTDHPVVWTKEEGAGHFVHFSLGFSWPSTNVYQQSDNYLTKLLYGTMRYVAKDFIGCTDSRFSEYNPDATKSVPSACLTAASSSGVHAANLDQARDFSYAIQGNKLRIGGLASGVFHASLFDTRGKVWSSTQGLGSEPLEMPIPSQNGVYLLRVTGPSINNQAKVFISNH